MTALFTAIWAWFEPLPGPFIFVLFIFAIGVVFWALKKIDDWKVGGAPSNLRAKVEPSLGDFTIDYAGYGLGPGQYRNVTDRVRSLVKNGKLDIIVGPESLQCEVYSGAPGKHLLVIYSHGENEGLCKKTDVYQRMILP